MNVQPTDQFVGIIGGSGLYQLDGLVDVDEVAVETPFGIPSAPFRVGRIGDRRVAFLARHGDGHRYTPTEINYRANICGLKQLGVRQVISVSAVGSMKEEIRPGEFVVVDQFIDRTKRRVDTFFGEGVVGHVQFADPTCPCMRSLLQASCNSVKHPVHKSGTYVCIEGPQFSTRAESNVYRSWGVDVIGMTNLPEAKLAREAGLCYATLAMVTDYDCWREGEEAVSVAAVMEMMATNVTAAKRVVIEAVSRGTPAGECNCAGAGAGAVVTTAEAMNSATRARLEAILEE